MLQIFYGDYKGEDYISAPDIFFDNVYEDEWITDDLSVRMIKDVDGSDVKGPNLIDSPFLGPIPPRTLSGGVKTLILIQNDPAHVFNASACGNNCARWLIEIGKKIDVRVRLGYLMDFGDGPFEIRVLNTDRVCTCLKELDEEVILKKLV